MVVSLKHKFNLAKADGLDATAVKPSDWNDEHNLTAATGKVLGTPKGSSIVSELPLEVDANLQSVILPPGTTLQRPGTPLLGMMRLNTTLNRIEAFLNSAWTAIGRGVVAATSAPTDNYAGDMYFNTSTGVLQVFDGAAFVTISPPDGSLAATKLVAALQNAFVPPGSILSYAGSAAPTGFLLCFGQAVSRTANAALFTAIGTTYGAGDGSTTFNLPDFRGRVPAGLDNMGGSAAGRLAATRTVAVSTISQTTTTVTVTTTASHGVRINQDITISGAGNAVFNGLWTVTDTPSPTTLTFTRGTSVTITAVAGGTFTVPIINGVNGSTLGAAGGAQTHTMDVAEIPAHGHPQRLAIQSAGSASSNTTGGILMAVNGAQSFPDWNGPVSNSTGQQIGGTGGDGPHNNVQPTIVTNFIIKT